MQLEEIKLLSDDAIRRLYEQFSDREYCAQWMNTDESRATEFLAWLETPHTPPCYETEGLTVIRGVLAHYWSEDTGWSNNNSGSSQPQNPTGDTP